MEKLLIANERVHEFKIEGIVQGQKVKGDFKAKYPSVLDNIKIQSIHSNLVKDANLETFADVAYDATYIMAYLDVTLTEKPEWFDFDVIDNFEIVYEVFEGVRKFADSFRSGTEEGADRTDSTDAKGKKTVESK